MLQRLRPDALAIAIAVLFALSPVSHAADRPMGDRIILNLASEGWVKTDTAEVILTVNASMREDQAAQVRGTIMSTLERLSKDADWRITTFNRNADRSGLDSWFVQAQARIPDTALDGLRQAADKASKPGLKITVSAINFTPTLAEVEATRAKLRQQIYADALAELKRANTALPDKGYRIGMINFTRAMPVQRAQNEAYARTTQALAAPAPGNIAVQDHVRLQATVVLTTGDGKED